MPFGSQFVRSRATFARTCGAIPSTRRKAKGNLPLLIGHRLMGTSLLYTGEIGSRAHLEQALALYDPAEHRSLARDLAKTPVTILYFVPWRSGSWLSRSGARFRPRAQRRARKSASATLMSALATDSFNRNLLRSLPTANTNSMNLSRCGRKGAFYWKALGTKTRLRVSLDR